MHYTLCDLLTDLTQNAVEAESTQITVELRETISDLTVYIKDNGKGMNEQTLKRVTDPFYTDGIKHPKRKIGLGIPFLIQTVTDTDGSWSITSEQGKGTTVFARFNLENIDTPPLGDVPGFFRQILIFPNEYDLCILRKKSDAAGKMLLDYETTRSELVDALGNLENVQSLSLLGEYLVGLEDEDAEDFTSV